jgi:hypothetical protein
LLKTLEQHLLLLVFYLANYMLQRTKCQVFLAKSCWHQKNQVNTSKEISMLKAIFNWFSHKQPAPEALAPAVRAEDAPYKIEPPVAPVLVGQPQPVPEVAESEVKKPARRKKSVADQVQPGAAKIKKAAAPRKNKKQ